MGITATPTRPTTAVALGRAVDAMARRRAADVDLLLAAIEWAELHPPPSARCTPGGGRECGIRSRAGG